MRRRMVVMCVVMMGMAVTLVTPDSEAKSSARQRAQRACSASCGSSGYNKCRVDMTTSKQCLPSMFLRP